MTPHPPAVRGDASPPRGPGLLLVVPAALTWLVTLVVPTGQTIWRSTRHGGMMRFSGGFTGPDNYTHLLREAVFWKALAFSLSLAIVPLLVMLLVGPALAAALERAGTWPRRAGRVLLSLPLVVFSPVAVAAAWLGAQQGGGIATAFGRLRDIGPSSPTLPLITAAAMFGFVCGLALLAFLPVLRGRTAGRPVTPAMVVVGALVVLTGLAVALQALSLDLVTVGGRQPTLAMLQFREAYTYFDFGSGAAVSTLMGLMLAVLGVLATVVAVRTGLRIELGPAEASTPGPRSGGRTLVAVAAVAVVLALTVVFSWPWLSGLFSGGRDPAYGQPSARVYAATWIPPLLGAVVSVGTAYLAALGIGGLRPLGRHSEWLLLVFAPWLFVGAGPLSVADFDDARRLGLLNHFLGLVPPILLSVPSLLVLTLFCRGRAARWQAEQAGGAPAFVRLVAAPALPLAGLMGGVTVLFGAHGVLWPLLVGTETQTAPTAVLRQTAMAYGGRPHYGPATPLVAVVLLFLALAALQVWYLDRLVITIGDVTAAPRAPWGYAPAPYGPYHPYGPPPPGYGPPAYGPPPTPPPAPAGERTVTDDPNATVVESEEDRPEPPS